MKVLKVNDEVYYDKGPIVDVSQVDIEYLKTIAANNVRKRSRLCAHPDPADTLHEMLIIHEQSAYVRAHSHLCRSESLHVVCGSADVVIFGPDGGVSDVIEVGEYSSGKTFYYRIPGGVIHTLLIRTEVFVFHEVTSGPFNPDSSHFPDWAPMEDDPQCISYIDELEKRIKLHHLK